MGGAAAYLEGLAGRGVADAARAVRDVLLSTATPESDAEALAYAAASMPRATRAAALAGIASALPLRALDIGPHACALALEGAVLAEIRDAGLEERSLHDLMLRAPPQVRAAYEHALRSSDGELRAALLRERAAAATAAADAEAAAMRAANERAVAAARDRVAAAIAAANAQRVAAGLPPVPESTPDRSAPIAQRPEPAPPAAAPGVALRRAPLALGQDAIDGVTWSAIAMGGLLIVAAWLGSGFGLQIGRALLRALPAVALTVIGVVIARRLLSMRQPGDAWIEWDERGITEHDADGVRARVEWADATRAVEKLYRTVRIRRRRYTTILAGEVLQISDPSGTRITVWNGRHAGPPTWLLRRKTRLESVHFGALAEATRHLPAARGIAKDREARRRLDGFVGGLVTSLAYGVVATVAIGPYFGRMPAVFYEAPYGIAAASALASFAVLALRASLPAFELAMLTIDRSRPGPGAGRRSLQLAIGLEVAARLALAFVLAAAFGGACGFDLLIGRW